VGICATFVLSFGMSHFVIWQNGRNVLQELASSIFGYENGAVCATEIFIF
jgi:hypothetical protein